MANESIKAGFQRLWQHTKTLVNGVSLRVNSLANEVSVGFDNCEWRIDDAYTRLTDVEDRVTTLEGGDPCLIAGTQILMADGTTKNIEDLTEGDMIKSWDVVNNEYIDVKCLARIRTGVARDWQLHVFDNNSVLTIYEAHAIYSKKRGCPKPSAQWQVGDIALSLDGADTEFCGVVKRTDDHYTDRYTLITDNNLYFANGILCGHYGHKKIAAYNNGHIKNATEEELARYRAESEIYDTFFNWRTNPEYLVASTKIRAQFLKAEKAIEQNKKSLAGLDYKTIKKLQGELSDEEWAETVAYCKSCREIINEKEVEKENLQNQLRAIRDDMGIVHRYIPDCFKACFEMDLAAIKAKTNE